MVRFYLQIICFHTNQIIHIYMKSHTRTILMNSDEIRFDLMRERDGERRATQRKCQVAVHH